MSPNEQRIAIAEVCGWTSILTSSEGFAPLGVLTPQLGRQVLPEYPSDLNAMHRAELGLIFSQRKMFRGYLQEVCSCGVPGLIAIEECIHATAAQRAEAFLRTIGIWRCE